MASRTTLRAGYADIAIRIQEAADELSSNDVRARLADALQDASRQSGNWNYYIDHFGDAESGDVIYSCSGDTMRAPYSISGGAGSAAKCVIDMENATDVVPRTIYEPEADEEDHYAAMEESFKAEKVYTSLPLYERFISKDERKNASADDFAGKGKSFPILKPEDIPAAVHSMGRAGAGNLSPSGIKARIIAIAKRKGWTKYLPKSWQADEGKAKEAAEAPKAGVRLIESAAASFIGNVKLSEATRSTYPILLISPGTGTKAHYPAGVLKKAAEAGVFKAKTFMYWNHPTAAQEAARPEGDLDNLAAITTKDGVWMDNGPKGPGVYAEAKPMADYAQKIEERAPYIGLSIRAGGTASGRTVNGKPELASIDHVESVDYVTRAGRGGMALAESEKFVKLLESLNEGEVSDMDAAEIKKLQESLAAQTAINERLVKRALRADAMELAGAVLATTSLSEAQRKFVAELVIGTADSPRELAVKESGELDPAKLTEAVNAAAKSYSATLPVHAGPRGMGAPGPVAVAESAEQKTARETRAKEMADAHVKSLMELGLSEAAAKSQVGVAA